MSKVTNDLKKLSKLEREIRECKLCRYYYARPGACIANDCMNEKKPKVEVQKDDECYRCSYRRGDQICNLCMKKIIADHKERWKSRYEKKAEEEQSDGTN